MKGKLFGPAYMQEIWNTWRPSIAELNWVICPADPNQVDDELIWHHFALIASAILALWSEFVASGEASAVISAIEVHEFMLGKAKGCAVTQSILN